MNLNEFFQKILSAIRKLIIVFSFHYPKLFKDETFVKLLYFFTFLKLPNLNTPRTFNENICKLKLDDCKLSFYKFTDKYEVRSYVKKEIGSIYLNHLYGVFDSFDEINFDTLPKNFVLKCTHASGYNLIVKDKSSLNIKKVRKNFNKWLSTNYFYYSREKNYKQITPRIICEQYLDFDKEKVFDYKLFCFNGKVKFIQANLEYNQKRISGIYSLNWEIIPVVYGYKSYKFIKKPFNLKDLIFLSEKLARIFSFVRVDFLEINGSLYFGELTFHSGGGMIPFIPTKYDLIFGKYFK